MNARVYPSARVLRTDSRYALKLAVCLAAVWLIWGSTFLFTKLAVERLPIALYSAVRFLTAGGVLAFVARFYNGQAWPRRLADWRHVAITGFFMVFASNGLNAWAMQYMPSNESALLNGTAAFWIAGLGVLGPRGQPLSRAALVGLGIGFAGTALMLSPSFHLDASGWFARIGVLGACLAFSLGTLYYRSVDTSVNPLMFIAMQLCCGGTMLLVVAVADGDPGRWTFNGTGIIALTYLTFISSCLAFTAYGWLTRNSTPALIGTYSYVNPAVAALLGWRFLHEALSRRQIAGMVIILVGVIIVTRVGGRIADAKTLAEPKAQ